MSGAPILPISRTAAATACSLSGIVFIIPKPSARIVIAVGEPCHIERQIGMSELEPMQQTLHALEK
ncbi:lysophospholipid acyltransferase family protein [Thiohalophilus thiocyanatoxydans]|uniref:hypothetical protein n=1 Tax=Thiohalophilus thiocyanatoxydans TaxID=381308 RepID=UPI001066E5F5|nr:hypothetical protein [Thiohalophilus thiocyanatoxydans]